MAKPPAFMMYASDFLQGTTLMTPAEVGAYIRLLCHSWCSGPISKNPELRARAIGCDVLEAERIWSVIRDKFYETDHGFLNSRMEAVREGAERYRKAQSAKSRQTWKIRKMASHRLPIGQPEGSLCSSSLSSYSLSKDQDQNTCSAPPQTAVALPAEAVLTFPVRGPGASTWALTRDRVDDWQAVFPGMDVLHQCQRALLWVNAKPSNRKTRQGMPAFLVRWLNRAADGPPAHNAANGRKTVTEHAIDAARKALDALDEVEVRVYRPELFNGRQGTGGDK